MAKPETVYAITTLMQADEGMQAEVKMAITDLLENGVKTPTVFLTTQDAWRYCMVSRPTFYRHIRQLCKPIRVGFRTYRYQNTDLDRVMKIYRQNIGEDDGQ